jgi:lipopolysaccharide/colanic/teichoic acid biosynthesis glycosyltransferase
MSLSLNGSLEMLWQLTWTALAGVVSAGSRRRRTHGPHSDRRPGTAGGHGRGNGNGKGHGNGARQLNSTGQRNTVSAVSTPCAEDAGATPRDLRELARRPRKDAAQTPGLPAAERTAQTFRYAVCKRIIDVVLAAASLPAAAVLIGLITFGIWVTLGRPIFFSQQRVGRGGRLFRLYKFRTLEARPVECSEVEWSAPASHPFAAFLRRSGLDELPQLLNVLRGEMSLIGPRPERPHFVKVFQADLPAYGARHALHAGISGWAQVNGFRGDTSIARRLDHDLYYLHHWSLGFDLRILLLTLLGLASNLWMLVRGGRSDGVKGSV